MPNSQIVVRGADEADSKAPLAENEEEEFFGDPVPARIQATTALGGICAGIFLIMGLVSSEWVYAVGDHYHQGLFICCSWDGFNETYSGEVDDDFKEGCERIDLTNQGYTMFAAFLCATALATVIFSTMLALLGSWVQDIDSKRKVYRLSLYLMIVSVITNILSLIVYSVNFDDVLEHHSLGPFEDPDDDDWEFGWSAHICMAAILVQGLTGLAIAYGLLLFPIEETVDEEGTGGDK